MLQRDLTREEKRIQEEELERARAAAAAQPVQSDADIDMTNASEAQSKSEVKTRQSTPVTGKAPLRRPSKVSLSTLHRDPFPLKLDLSSASLRLDEANLNMSSFGLGGMGPLGAMGGLASPVTLAPKSARPMGPGEIPPELFAAFATAASNSSDQDVLMQNQDGQRIEIDLTLDDELHKVVTEMDVLGAGTGHSADQPIDVDMDLDQVNLDVNQLPSDFFGEDQGVKPGSNGQQDVDDLFSPAGNSKPDLQDLRGGTESIDMSILTALSSGHGETEAILASLDESQANPGNTTDGSASVFANDSSAANPSFDYSQFRDMEDFLNASKDMTQFLGPSLDDSSGKPEARPEETKSPDKPRE